MLVLLSVLLSFQGRANYTNLSRYSDISEKTYRRWFSKKKLDFIEFNQLGNDKVIPATAIKVAALDSSFVSKSGKKTYGLGHFYNSAHSKAQTGLEISTLAIVDVDFNTAYHVSTRQTSEKSIDDAGTRVDEYLRHFTEDCKRLPNDIGYLVTDGYYSKQKFVNGVLAAGYHQIGKLRTDANLRYLYTGEQKPKGRPKLYGDKIIIGDVDKLEFVQHHENQVEIYTAIVNSVSLKRNIRLVFLKCGNRVAVLFSTDTQLDAKTIFRYYKARFQIEFLFRDAKQFTGLTHCQARSKTALDNHFNASFSALNLIKWHDRQHSPKRKAISISYWKRLFFNTLFLERISCNLAFELNSVKSSSAYSGLCHFGIIR